MSNEKRKFVEVKSYEVRDEIRGTMRFLGSYVTTPEEAAIILDEIAQSDKGYWEARIVWMAQDEFDALGDFEGF